MEVNVPLSSPLSSNQPTRPAPEVPIVLPAATLPLPFSKVQSTNLQVPLNFVPTSSQGAVLPKDPVPIPLHFTSSQSPKTDLDISPMCQVPAHSESQGTQIDLNLDSVQAQFLPSSFVVDNFEQFSERTFVLLICNRWITKVDSSHLLTPTQFLQVCTTSKEAESLDFPWLLLARCSNTDYVICPTIEDWIPQSLEDLPLIDVSMLHPYFVPTVPLVTRPLTQIVVLLKKDVPPFEDKYGLNSSNQYLTPPWIRPGIAREMGFVFEAAVCHPDFSPFIVADSRKFQPTPFLTQGPFPKGLVGNGPWLERPSSVNFTTCHTWIQKSLLQLPKQGGFSWLFRWTEGVEFRNGTFVSEKQELPHWLQMIQGKNVAVVVFSTPIAYWSFKTLRSLPRPNFRTCLILFGFEQTLLFSQATEFNPDFGVFQKLRPTQSNWVPLSVLEHQVREIGSAFVARSREVETLLRSIEFASKPVEFQRLYLSARKHPKFTDLECFHHQVAPDFEQLSRVRLKHPTVSATTRTVGWKCNFLRSQVPAFRRRRSQLLQRRKQICCECHRTGHDTSECLFRTRSPQFLTEAQQLLYEFLGNWKSKVKIKHLGTEGKSPNLAQLQKFSRELKKREKSFWQSFFRFSRKRTSKGLSPEDCGFKQWCFGNIQEMGIPFFANLGLPRAFLLQLVVGFYLPLRQKNGRVLRPPRVIIVNDYKKDPELWDHFKEVAQKNSAYIPIPLHFIELAENCFKVREPTPTNPNKIRLISDTRLANVSAPDFHTRLPQSDFIVDQVKQGATFVAHDFTKFYTQLIQEPRSAARHALVLKDVDGKVKGFLPTGLVFGAKLAPFIAIAITSFLSSILCQLGLLSFAYIDDILIQVSDVLDPKNASDLAEIEAISDWTAQFLGMSGLILSKSKISAPGTEFSYLKWIISTSTKVRALPSSAKLEAFFADLAIPLSRGTLSAQHALEIEGKVNYLDPSNIFARRLVHTCALHVQDICHYFGVPQFHLLKTPEKNFLRPVSSQFGYLVLKWLHSTSFEILPRGFRESPKTLHFYRDSAFFGHLQTENIFLLVTDASETSAGGFTMICKEKILSDPSDQVIFPFPDCIKGGSSLVRELWGILQLFKRFLPVILEKAFENIRVVTDNFGAVYVLSLFETHRNIFVNKLVSNILQIVEENCLNIDFVWERRSTKSMQAADILSKYLVKLSRASLPANLEKLLISYLGKDFKIVPLGRCWDLKLAQTTDSNQIRALLVFPLAHELAYQWFLRLAPLARDQVWLVPHFPNKLPWPIFRDHGFHRITGNTYKSLIPDIPTTCTYSLWLTPSL